MGAAEDVAGQFFGAGSQDQCTIYDGFPQARAGVFGWFRVPDIRAVVFTLAHDLLRGLVPQDRAGQLDISVPWGFRDSVSVQHMLAVQNNWLLTELAKAGKVDVTKMPGHAQAAKVTPPTGFHYHQAGLTVLS